MLGHTAFRSRPSSLALVFHSVLVSTFCMHPPMLLRIYASILSFLPVWMDPSLEAEGTGRQCKKEEGKVQIHGCSFLAGLEGVKR